MNRVVLLSFLFIIMKTSFAQDCRCNVALFRRRACRGVANNASERQCRDAGCCYDATNYRTFFTRIVPCFQKTGICPTYTCDVAQDERITCGFYFKYACERRRCCHDATSRPSCFKRQRLDRTTTTATVSEAVTTTSTTTIPTTLARLLASWTGWGSWSACTSSCTAATRTRRRFCVSFEGAQESDAVCGGDGVMTQPCSTQLCTRWGPWVENGVCSASCNETGILVISRTCEGRGYRGDRRCYLGTRPCRNQNCRTEWASWLSWSQCSGSLRCSPGTRYRYRPCMLGGVSTDIRNCVPNGFEMSRTELRDEIMEIEQCNAQMCSSWSEWSQYGSCSCHREGRIPVRTSTRGCVRGGRTPSSIRERIDFENCATRSLRCFSVQCPDETTSSRTSTTASEATTSLAARSEIITPPTTTSPATTSPTTTTPEVITSSATSTSEIMTSPTTVPPTTTSPTTMSAETTASETTSFSEITEEAIVATTDQSFFEQSGSSDEGEMTWSEWSRCSRSCGPGVSIRIRVCTDASGNLVENDDGCSVDSTIDRRRCNVHLCHVWTRWNARACLANCSDTNEGLLGERRRFRECTIESQDKGEPECYDVATQCISQMPCTTTTPPEVTTTPTPEVTTTSTTTTPEVTTTSTTPEVTTTSTTTTPEVTTTTPEVTTTSTTTTPEVTTTSTTAASPITTPPTTTMTTSRATTTVTWGEWEEWGPCSRSCTRGTQSRLRTCIAGVCDGPNRQTMSCNDDYCDDWTPWTTSCSQSCGSGRVIMKRSCNVDMNMGPNACYTRELDGICNTQPCDDDLDFFFLLDSSDHVDNCRGLRSQNYSVPVGPEFLNYSSTPVYAKMKEFMTEFSEGWRAIEDTKSHIGIQLFSRACSVNTERNLHIPKDIGETHDDFVRTSIDPLPYLCGGFYLDWALTCAMNKAIVPARGDRADVPNVLIVLLSRVPSYARPSTFLLTAISQRLMQGGTTIISASVTPPSSITSDIARTRYDEMLTTLACGGSSSCSAYIGSIWDENNGSPAERIRSALQQANII